MTSRSRPVARTSAVPVPLWAAPGDPPFVGRADELRVIDGARVVADSGRARTVFVLGEAGAGKSRLVAEASVRAWGRGAEVLLGGCLPDAPVAYEPFREPLLQLLDDAAGGLPATEIALVRDLLASSGKGPRARARQAGTPEAFDAVVSLLGNASAERSLVLVLEDLHWATPSTVDLLAWVVRRAIDARLMVLATSRNTRPDLSDSLREVLADLHRLPRVSTLELGGLAIGEIAELVVAEVGVEPAIAADLAGTLQADTAGNPFLLREICRDPHLREHLRAPSHHDVHVPESVLGIFESRLREYPEPQRRVLELAAVLGARFPLALLDAVTDSDPATMAALDRATETGLLVALPAGQGFAFRHALARQSVLGLTAPARLAAAHGRVADVLAPRAGDTLPEVERLAHHNLQAYGRTDQARRYLIRAAELAARSWAYVEAAGHYQRAGELSGTAVERHHLLLLAADCLQSSGAYAAARDLAEDVVAQSGDPATRLAAATLVETEATLLGGDLRAVTLLLAALMQHPLELDNPRYLRALAGLSRGLGQVLDSPDAFRLNDAVLALARRSGDEETLGAVLSAGLPLAFGRPARTGEALRAARELTTLARRGDAQRLGSSGFFRCLLGMRAGSMEDVTAGVVDYRIAFDLGGHLWFEYWPEAVEFDLRFMRGDFAGAEQVARRMRDWVVARGGPGAVAHYGIQVFQLRREQGRLAGVRDLLTGDEPCAGTWAPALLALYTELRMADPARRMLDALADEAVLAANRRTEYMPTALSYMVEAALFLDDNTTLRRLRPLVAEHSGLNLVSDQFIALSGAADRYLGMIDAATGDADPIPSLDAAAELARRCGFAVDLSLTLAARARHLARRSGPRSRDVLDAATAARAIAEPIGQVRVLRALSALEPRSAAPGPIPDSRLTGRELEVLGLLAEGASNRQIAERLVISENTAANHVRSILAKTGVANRTQAAILAVSRGWVNPART
jgi:DNA-binding CsgD family transcriptional regulator